MDERKITIEIIGGGSSGSSLNSSSKKQDSEQTKANKQKQDILKTIFNPINTFENQLFENSDKSWKTNCAKQIYDNAKQTLLNGIDYAITRHNNLTEDYLAENQYKVIKGSYQKISGFFSSVGNGAIQGASFGTTGAIVGALVSGVSWGVKETTSYNQRWSSYHQQLNAVNFNTQFNSKRAGLYDGGRGTIE